MIINMLHGSLAGLPPRPGLLTPLCQGATMLFMKRMLLTRHLKGRLFRSAGRRRKVLRWFAFMDRD